jgi:hypothetical protein
MVFYFAIAPTTRILSSLSDVYDIDDDDENINRETPLTCNNKPIFYNLRDPVSSIASSVAEALSGLLPLHVSHSPSSSSSSFYNNWIWSVGHNPFSITSPGMAGGTSSLHHNAGTNHTLDADGYRMRNND